MNKSGMIAERYAEALFGLAGQAGLHDAVARDLSSFSGFLAQSADLRSMIDNPLNRRADQARALFALAQKAELTDLVARFLGVLARARRLEIFPLIAEAYRRRLSDLRGEHLAEVTSATPLRPGQVEALRDRLASRLGGAVHLTLRVDPRLLGGLVVRLGSRLVDASLDGKLERMSLLMKGTV